MASRKPLPVPPRCHLEGAEVTEPGIVGGLVLIVKGEMIGERFPNPHQLSQAAPVLRCPDGQVEELERPFKGPLTVLRPVLDLPVDGLADFSPHVRHLLEKG